MFKSISWQEFLYTIGLLSIGYYAVVAAIFYSRDILSRVKATAVRKVSPHKETSSNLDHPLMGKILSDAPKKNIPIKQSVADPEDLTFESQPEKDLLAQQEDSPAAAFLEDLDEMLIALVAKKSAKETFVKSIRNLLKRNPELRETPARDQINNYIVDYFKNSDGKFSSEDIQRLWFIEKEKSVYQSNK